MATKRGRKSSGDLTVVRVSGSRVAPPDWLNESETQFWQSIVESLPPAYFRPADVPLLAAYCTAAALHRSSREDIATNGTTIELDGGRKQMNPEVTIMQYQAGTMAQLAVKLRLAPSARVAPKSAAAASGDKALPQRKPWEGVA